MTIESEIERLDYIEKKCYNDLIFCDLDGMVVIPRKIEKIVIKKVLNRVAEENLVRKDLADGYKISEVWEKHHIL
jgi:regulator of RNase E activity RraA